MTKKEQFQKYYENSIRGGYDYLIIIVCDLLSDNKEIIINYYGQVSNKMKYYFSNYNDNLQLIRKTDTYIYKWMLV